MKDPQLAESASQFVQATHIFVSNLSDEEAARILHAWLDREVMLLEQIQYALNVQKSPQIASEALAVMLGAKHMALQMLHGNVYGAPSVRLGNDGRGLQAVQSSPNKAPEG